VRTVRILLEADIRSALDMASCIDSCESAFVAYSTGGAELPSVIHLDVPEAQGQIHVKAGHMHGAPYYAVKAASGFYAVDPRAVDGLVVVFDARDGSPAAFLMDNGYITDLRTGAAGGVAARHLAPEQVETVAVIGTGAQARFQLDALAIARPSFSRVHVWGRDADHASRCVEDLRSRPGLPASCVFETTTTVEAAVEGADVVITCTASNEALVQASWLSPGSHVTAVGSDGPGKQELDSAVLERADLLVVDSRDQCSRLGELQHVLAEASRAVELGEICAGSKPGRANDAQLTVCDVTGLGVQDVAAANAVMRSAGDAGLVLEI
jgi:ornithine cyclodeaminase/alanine dehydrogenase-like protein (mu-crystallin family)